MTSPPPPPPHQHRPPLRRGIYLLPSIFTTGNILLGFYAVVCGTRGQFSKAVLMVFAAGILDALDGRIARLSGTDSDFGREFDSLADVLTFGAAPALLCYLWGLHEYGRVGWLIPLYFLVCGATRLARFNVQVKVVDSRYFVGLPAPAAAGTVCAALYVTPLLPDAWWVALALFTVLVATGSLMVSTFRYRSFKHIDLRRRWSYRAVLPIAAVILVALVKLEATFLAVGLLYTSSAPAAWLWSRLRHRPRAITETPPELSEES
jgi:CDP-diacylglycerol--serine O-phosphatidyltransferase